MDLTRYDGKPFALLLMGETEDGQDDWAVFPGIARLKDSSLYIERAGNEPPIEIQPEWYERIKPTNDESRDILQGADYFLGRTVGNFSDEDAKDLQSIGLKWPK